MAARFLFIYRPFSPGWKKATLLPTEAKPEKVVKMTLFTVYARRQPEGVTQALAQLDTEYLHALETLWGTFLARTDSPIQALARLTRLIEADLDTKLH